MNLPSWFACASVMDLVPYYYYSYMRIWNGRQDVVVLGHWEPCPPGAKEIPFLHPYLSHLWHDERAMELDQLGELPFVLGRWKGTPNTRYAGQCFIGSETDWQRGGNYDTRPNLQVDEEGIPIGCCALPIGTGGHYFRQWYEERHWATVVRTGPRGFGHWNEERSWHGAYRTSAHHNAIWSHGRTWQEGYQTTDHCSGAWDHERSWGVIQATTSHYATSADHERSWQATYETTDHFGGDFDREQSWGTVVTTAGSFAASWDHERSWQAVIKTSGSYSASWDHERSWQAVYETLDHFAGAWDHERSWYGVITTAAHQAASWDHERSWQAFITTPVEFPASWDHERSWSAVIATVDNVQTFTCGTIVSAGTTQGTATAIANDTVGVTSTGTNQGVILPAGCYRVVMRNNNGIGGNSIRVYPPSGAQLGINGTNNFLMVNQGQSYLFIEVSATQWDYVQLT